MTSSAPLAVDGHWSNYVGGTWIDGADGGHIPVEDPGTGQQLATVAQATPTDVDRAVAAARACVDKRALIDMKPSARGQLLLDLSGWIEDHRPELCRLLTLDSGKTLTEAGWEIDNCTTFLSYYGGLADKIEGRYIPLGGGLTDYVAPVPYGVSGQIVPWNYPLEIAARGLGPAFAAGNAVVIKAPELDPLSVHFLARGVHEVGFPAGSVNVVTGYGPEAGAALAEHRDVDQLTFTGSVATGRSVLRAAAERIVPATVELGGKSAAIVLPDAVATEAGMDFVADQVRWAIWGNQGQVCSALSRLVVPRTHHDEVVERLVTTADALAVGPGVEDQDMGAIISAPQLEKIHRYATVARDEGAIVAAGGTPVEGDGYFYRPTVFAGVDNAMRIAQEEIFGPCLCVIPYDSLEQAVNIANDSEFGLVGGLFGNDLGAVMWASDRLEAGQIFVNNWFTPSVEAPFGGFKNSGFGREKGQAAVEAYYQWRNVAIAPGVR